MPNIRPYSLLVQYVMKSLLYPTPLQCNAKHEAIKFVGAIGHGVTLVSHTLAVQCHEKPASREQTAVQTMACSCTSAEEQLACKQCKQCMQTVLQDMQTD